MTKILTEICCIIIISATIGLSFVGGDHLLGCTTNNYSENDPSQSGENGQVGGGNAINGEANAYTGSHEFHSNDNDFGLYIQITLSDDRSTNGELWQETSRYELRVWQKSSFGNSGGYLGAECHSIHMDHQTEEEPEEPTSVDPYIWKTVTKPSGTGGQLISYTIYEVEVYTEIRIDKPGSGNDEYDDDTTNPKGTICVIWDSTLSQCPP